jgi:hypothetical protein
MRRTQARPLVAADRRPSKRIGSVDEARARSLGANAELGGAVAHGVGRRRLRMWSMPARCALMWVWGGV